MGATPTQPGPTAPRRLIRGNAADQIFEIVQEQILTGKYRRGAKLPTEKELALLYGVSGVTIRSAMRSLAAARLIEVKQGSGSYVTAHMDQLLADSLRSIIQVNGLTATELLTTLGGMNGFAAELAATRTTAEDIDRMQEALDAILEGETVDAISDHLKRFLDLLAEASGSSLLASFCKYLSALQIGLAWEISDGSLEGWKSLTGSFAKERQTIVDRLRERDSEGARLAAMTYHKSTCNLIAALPTTRQRRLDSTVASSLSNLVANQSVAAVDLPVLKSLGRVTAG